MLELLESLPQLTRPPTGCFWSRSSLAEGSWPTLLHEAGRGQCAAMLHPTCTGQTARRGPVTVVRRLSSTLAQPHC